jgi:hypothetical protein
MKVNPSRCDVLIAAMHNVALKAFAAAPNGQIKVGALMQTIESTVPLDECARTVYDNGNTRWRSVCRNSLSHKGLNWLESGPTHPPHVLVSAKVLLQSRRAKGGFSFGVLALHG